MKSFTTTLGFNREKEENWDIEEKAQKKGFSNTRDLLYLGYDVDMKVKVFEDGSHKVLSINGKDVSSLGIQI